jgi:tRNA(Ile2) C34 agmatinyltransferase TiaS
VSGAWEGLTAAASPTACPVCDGRLEPRWSAGAGVVGGRCRDCGSELS